MNCSRGTSTASDRTGSTATNTAVRPQAAPPRPHALAARYATVTAVPTTSPCERCALATCDHAKPASASHPSRARHRPARSKPAAPASSTVDQAIAPANGIAIAISLPLMIPAIDSPPTVAAIRPSPSSRKNAYIPRPASSGLSTTIARIATEGDSTEKSTIGGAYSHPLCGSAAKRYPAISNGFHTGIVPAATDRPRNDHRGSQKERMSGCSLVSRSSNTKPRNANTTRPAISSGPAQEAAIRRHDIGTAYPASLRGSGRGLWYARPVLP